VIEDLENLGDEHQIQKPNLIQGMTAFGELIKAGSQVEMSETPQFWDDPLLHMQGSCKPEWIGARPQALSPEREGVLVS
jgi:hypothetical protein